jgi:hypothetical protein
VWEIVEFCPHRNFEGSSNDFYVNAKKMQHFCSPQYLSTLAFPGRVSLAALHWHPCQRQTIRHVFRHDQMQHYSRRSCLDQCHVRAQPGQQMRLYLDHLLKSCSKDQLTEVAACKSATRSANGMAYYELRRTSSGIQLTDLYARAQPRQPTRCKSATSSANQTASKLAFGPLHKLVCNLSQPPKPVPFVPSALVSSLVTRCNDLYLVSSFLVLRFSFTSLPFI